MSAPLTELPFEKARGLFTDLDDTLTTHGKIPAETYRWLWRLKEKGLWVVVVSGRPAGWADCLMRLWPLDAMIFENGAGMMVQGDRGPKVMDLAPGVSREATEQRLKEAWTAITKAVPRAKLASDQFNRRFDYAVDFAEDPPHLNAEEIAQIEQELSKFSDITYKISSIHINYWVGSHTKVTACESLIKNYAKKWNADRNSIVFTGDSPNDEPLFEYFPLSVGVANLKPFLPRLSHAPKFLTQEERGAGFAEVCQRLLKEK